MPRALGIWRGFKSSKLSRTRACQLGIKYTYTEWPAGGALQWWSRSMPFGLRVGEIAKGDIWSRYGVGRDGRYIVARYPAANPNVAKASSAPSAVCHANQGLARQVSAGVMMWWRQEATRGGDGDWAGSLGPRLVPWTFPGAFAARVPFCWWPFWGWGRACSDRRFPSENGEGSVAGYDVGYRAKCRYSRWYLPWASCHESSTYPICQVGTYYVAPRG